MRHIYAVTFVALILAGCAGQAGEAIQSAFSRCVDVPNSIVERIQGRLNYVGGKASFRGARAVRSEDFDAVYLVSSDIEGSGLQKSQAIATWAAVGSLENPSAVHSIDGLARQFSDFPSGDTFSPPISIRTDGVGASRICALGRAGPLEIYESP